MFQIDAVSNVPIYRQVLEQLQRLIGSGQLKPGDSLPSVREVAIQNAVNPMTISKAYGLAESDGLILRQRGKPMTVAPKKKLEEEDRLSQLDAGIQALIEAAEQLDLNEKDVIRRINTRWRKFRK